MATTAVSSAKVAVVDSGEIGRYNNCHKMGIMAVKGSQR
jgi:hypothetical protein